MDGHRTSYLARRDLRRPALPAGTAEPQAQSRKSEAGLWPEQHDRVRVSVDMPASTDPSCSLSAASREDLPDVEADLVVSPMSGHLSVEQSPLIQLRQAATPSGSFCEEQSLLTVQRRAATPYGSFCADHVSELTPSSSNGCSDVSDGVWRRATAADGKQVGWSRAQQPNSLHNTRISPTASASSRKPNGIVAPPSPDLPSLEWNSPSDIRAEPEQEAVQHAETQRASHVAHGESSGADRGLGGVDQERNAASHVWKAIAASAFENVCPVDCKDDAAGLVSAAFREFYGSMISALQLRAAAMQEAEEARYNDEAGSNASEETGSDSSRDSSGGSKERRRRIRARKLRAFASNEIDQSNLRSLFRLLDDDGSGEISPDEIRRGLVLLGLQGVSDPVALSRIVCDIDEDKTGTITEGEFLAFFSQHTISSLKSLLDDYALDHCHIIGTAYGLLENGGHRLGTDAILCEHVKQWLSTKMKAGQNVWFDLVGYKASTFTALADALNVDAKVLVEALTFKLPGVEVLASNRCTQITAHHMTLSTRPITVNKDSSKGLAKKADVLNIAISLEQTAILVINDKVLITLRCPLKPYSREEVHRVASAEGGNPFADDTSGVQSLYDRVRGRMEKYTPDTEHLFEKGASALSVCLLDAILTGNYDASDEMQDWEELISKHVRSKFSSKLTVHLESIRRITNTYERHITPLVDELSLERWSSPVQAGSRSGGSVHSGGSLERGPAESSPHWKLLKDKVARGAALKDRLKSALAETITREGEPGSPEAPPFTASGLRNRRTSKLSAIGSFLAKKTAYSLDQVYDEEDRMEFEELAEDLKGLITAMQAKKERIEELTRLLAYIKTDMMNRTLYALTLITAVATPITFLTGIWGMNFQDMSELTPETGGSGYKTFWIALSGVLVVILSIIRKLRLLESLK